MMYSADAAAKLLQSCPTLYDPIDGSPSGSTVPGILQARTLEWGAIAFSVSASKYYLIILILIVFRGCQFLNPSLLSNSSHPPLSRTVVSCPSPIRALDSKP